MKFHRVRIQTKRGEIAFDTIDKWIILFVLSVSAAKLGITAADAFVSATSVWHYLHGAMLTASTCAMIYMMFIFNEFVDVGFRSVKIVVDIAGNPRAMQLIKETDQEKARE